MVGVNTDIELTKLYYSIGEVAYMFNVNTSLIRFWEKEFTIIKPSKNKKGNRLFTKKDVLNFQKIYQWVKIEGYTLEGAKQKLKKGEQIEQRDQPDVIQLLETLKSKLLQFQNEL